VTTAQIARGLGLLLLVGAAFLLGCAWKRHALVPGLWLVAVGPLTNVALALALDELAGLQRARYHSEPGWSYGKREVATYFPRQWTTRDLPSTDKVTS
jgi:hypothetical protein